MRSHHNSICFIEEDIGPVRTVAVAVDRYQGLKGHDYIKARNLNPQVQRHVQTSAQTATPLVEVRK